MVHLFPSHDPVVEERVIEVPDPPVPAVSSFNDPFKVEITPEDPPHPDVPYPNPAV